VTMIFAHITDTHLGQRDGVAARRRTKAVVDYLAGLPGPLAAVLLTGDIADHGLPAEYREAAEVLAPLPAPVMPCPGNHDERTAYQRAFLGEPDSGGLPVNKVHRVAGATFAMCDSSIPGADDGFLSDDTLAWLDAELASAPDSPAFVCFHHPPVELHSPFVDEIRLGEAENLAELLARHQHVAAVLCGHAHTAAASTFAGRPLLVAPGVVSTGVLPFENSTPVDFGLPPAIAFHVLAGDRGLVTHFRSL
jgi:3',5'-cyclic-AMP phosphodiesterase